MCCKIGTLLLLVTLLTSLIGCKPARRTTPTPGMDAQPQCWVRVLLLNDATTCTLDFASPFDVTCVTPDSNSQPQQKLSAGSPKWDFQYLDAPITITVSAGKINVAGQSFDGNEVTICPKEPHVFTLNGSDYRGKIGRAHV